MKKTDRRIYEDTEKFVEGVDYYNENGFMILTGHYLLKRGYCCDNGCRHCPYPKDSNRQSKQERL